MFLCLNYFSFSTEEHKDKSFICSYVSYVLMSKLFS